MFYTKIKALAVRGKTLSVISYLTISDIFVWGSIAIGSPLLAIYLSGKFGAQTVEYIGIGAAVYYLMRGLTQVPLGSLTDRIKSDKDEIALLILGTFLMAVPYLFFPSISLPWHYFLLRAIEGLGTSLNLNNWRKLFAKNLDKNREGVEYGMYETILSLSTAVLGVVGGYTSSISKGSLEMVIAFIGILIFVGGAVATGIYTIDHRKSEK